MKKQKPIKIIGPDENVHIYYSAETDELFSLPLKPSVRSNVYKLFVEETLLLSHVLYLGEL